MTTYTHQPAEAQAYDTYMDDGAAESNFETNAEIKIGGGAGGAITRTLWKNDFALGTNPPTSSVVVSAATLTLYLNSEASSSAVDLECYKNLRDWVEAQATWNIWKTANNWDTAGCGNTTTDRENTILGTLALSATEAAGSKVITLNNAIVQGWINGTISNYGFLIKTSSEAANTRYEFASSTDGTAGRRPLLTVEYTAGGGLMLFSS